MTGGLDANTPAMTVTAGEITVGDADLVLNTSQARAWHVDVQSKYAAVFGLGARRVLLGATVETREVNEAARGTLTVLTFDVPDDWILIAECVRYTCRVVAYNPTAPADAPSNALDEAPRGKPRQLGAAAEADLGPEEALLSQICVITDRAGYGIPKYVAQAIVNVVARTVADAIKDQAPDTTSTRIDWAWKDAARIALDFTG